MTAEQAERWDADGYLLAEGVLDPDVVAGIRAIIDVFDAVKQQRMKVDPAARHAIDVPDVITFTVHHVLRSPEVRAFARSEPFARLAADLVGPDVRLYWDQSVYKHPETAREFPWHQDNGYTFVLPQHYLTCWVPLVDATVDNGCPWVVPGGHLDGTLEHWWTDTGWRCLHEADNAVPVEAKVGDVICFSSLMPHRTGPNLSTQMRKAYILQYASDETRVVRDGELVPQDDPDRQFPVVRAGRPCCLDEGR